MGSRSTFLSSITLLALAAPAAAKLTRLSTQKQLASTEHLTNYRATCLKGRQVPTLYILGAQKAATTSLFHDLESLGLMYVTNSDNGKEFHFLDNWEEKAGNYSYETHIAWLGKMPFCPTEGDEQKVLMDATPCDVRMVPLPTGTRPTGSHWGRYFLTHKGTLPSTSGSEMDLPGLLQQFYGEHQRKLVFVVMLREPLSRMQSAWYHSRTVDPAELPWEQCRDCMAASFAEALNATVARASSPSPTYDDWMWASMYGRQLKHWMSVYDSSHFIIVPQRTYINDGNVKACMDVARKLDLSLNCQALEGQGANPSTMNAHKHPPLEGDAPQELQNKFKEVIERENTILFETLATAHVNGASLTGYIGPAGDRDQIKEWLERSW